MATSILTVSNSAGSAERRGIVAVHTAPPAKPVSEPADPEALFREGLRLLNQEGLEYSAMVAFESACRANPLDARYTSYYGLSLALQSRRLKEAEALCAQATKIDFFRPELFYNLGRVRLLRKDRKGAFAAFKQGLSVKRDDARIQKALAKLGKRRPPVFPFLSRRHALNKWAGIVVSRLGKGEARSANPRAIG